MHHTKHMQARRWTGLVCLALTIALFTHPAAANAANAADAVEIPPEQAWLLDNFSGPFRWSFLDLESGEVTATGTGDCEVMYGNRFLRCVHKASSGEELGVGVSGYDPIKSRYQWVYYGANSSAMLYGEGHRDAERESSYIEGTQKLPNGPEFTFRTVTKKLADGEWLYSHYRLDGEEPVEMFRAQFSYNVEAGE